MEKVYAYSPYGEVAVLGPDGGNDLQYGALRNDGTGLYHATYRYYDPILKQWTSEDPIGLAGGLNQRAYVGDNPLGANDPLGLLSPNFLMQFLPTPVINQLVNFASYVPPPVAAAALLSALKAYEYTVAINLVIYVGARASLVAGAGYLGYQAGGVINEAIEKMYGQGLGGILYDLKYGKAEAQLIRAQVIGFGGVCRAQ